MNNIKIEHYYWGPPLLKTTVNPNISKTLNSNLYIKDVDLITPMVDIESRKVYDLNNKEIFDLFSPYLRQSLKFMGISNEFRFTQIWRNVYKSNHYIPNHTHNEGDLSFVLFTKVPPTALLDKIKGEGNIVFEYGESPDWRGIIPNIHVHSISPQINELYVFPSNLRHQSIPFQNPSLERISISGNIELL